MKFEVNSTDGNARAGTLVTSRSVIDTPLFMPCGTIGAVKAVRWNEIEDLGYRLVLMNALHMYLRPGADLVSASGGLHDFTSWRNSILTDSGGYQFFSLKGLYRIDDEGVSFQSPYDGSRHRFTPESVIDVQSKLGSDIVMPLDHCAPGDASREQFLEAGKRTIEWLKIARDVFKNKAREYQALFGIVQGGTDLDLRKKFTEQSAEFDLDGYAMGGISVGEDRDEGDDVVREIAPLMPGNKPRYLMGVGLPGQIIEGIESGIDMFDCVLPTRMARNGTLFTSHGRLNIRNAPYRNDERPIDEACDCPVCRRYSRSYLSHEYRAGEPGVLGLLSVHNLAYYKKLVTEARSAILEKRFSTWKSETINRWKNND